MNRVRSTWRRSAQFVSAALLSLVTANVGIAQSSASGTWQTISDVDGKPRALIEISEVNGKLVGVVRATLVPGEGANRICEKCSGARKGQPIIGMEILHDLHTDGVDTWSGGEILDPDSGKTYRAKLRLEDAGRRLIVRGYIGFSLIGRSQTWVRVPQ